MADPTAERLADLARLWNRIESRAKLAEQFRKEAITAAINEMRYAGRRIVDVLDISHNGNGGADDLAKIQEDLVIAKNYLINADHDITDAICFTAHKRFLDTIEVHGVGVIEACCPDFKELYPSIKAAHLIVQGTREERINRVSEYERLSRDYIPKILKLYEQIHAHPDLRLPDQAIALRSRIVWTRRFAFTASVASILGLLLTAISWAYPWTNVKTSITSLF